MKDITIKKVLDESGALSHIELHQGSVYIEVSLADTTIDVQRRLYKWGNLKRVVDSLVDSKVTKEDK